MIILTWIAAGAFAVAFAGCFEIPSLIIMILALVLMSVLTKHEHGGFG